MKPITYPAPSTPSFDVMTLADVCIDLVLTGDVRPRFHQVEQFIEDFSLHLGGSAAIFASQIARLGVSTAMLGWLGTDFFGNFVHAELERSGVDTTRIERHHTVKTCLGLALSEAHDRAILTYAGTLDLPSADDLDPALLASCRHWHIGAYFLMRGIRPAWKGWLELCRKANVSTSLDTNWDPEERWTDVLDLLPLTDVFLPNEAEALAISQKSDVYAAARELAKFGPLVVVKRGEKGALAVKGDRVWELDAQSSPVKPKKIVDTTGAGDNFDAGFICGWLKNAGVDDSLALGHRCAVSSLSHAGGIAGQIDGPRDMESGA